jgi:hypothetical protein
MVHVGDEAPRSDGTGTATGGHAQAAAPLEASAIRLGPFLAPAVAALLALAVAVAWTWPLAAHLRSWQTDSVFGPVHAWATDRITRDLTSGHLARTSALGFPQVREVRYMEWPTALLALPLRPVLGPLGAFHVAALLSFPANVLCTYPLLRRWTRALPATCAAGALLFATAPYLAGLLEIFEVPNLQAWTLPLFLIAFDAALAGRGAARIGLVAVTLATCLSAPYYGLVLPILAGGVAIARVRGRDAAGRATIALALVALAMLPARLYFGDPASQSEDGWLFHPGRRIDLAPLYIQGAISPIERLFVPPPCQGWPCSRHVAVVGMAVPIALAVLALARRGRAAGRPAGLALVATGLALALGPRRAVAGRVTPIPLPMALLDLLHYPLHDAHGLYRYVILIALGLAVLATAEAGRWRWGPGLAAVLVGVQILEVALLVGPRTGCRPVPAASFWERAAGDDGAVLVLPVPPPAPAARDALAAAVLHGRPVSVCPQEVAAEEAAAYWGSILASPSAARGLRQAGVRYVAVAPGSNAKLHLGQATADLDGWGLVDLAPTGPAAPASSVADR